MDAIGSVDFQLYAVFFLGHFVDGGGAEILARVAVLDHAFCGADVEVADNQVAGLIFFVARAGVIDVGQAIEGELAVAFEAFGRGVAVDFVIVLVASIDAHGIDQAAAAGDELQAGVEQTAEKTVLEGLMKIADGPEFFLDVALLDFLGESAEGFRGGIADF